MFKKITAIILTICFTVLFAAGCGNSDGAPVKETSAAATEAPEITTKLPKLDMAKWKHSDDFGFYYQTGVTYCETPADEKYEQLAVFVPEEYMKGTKNADDTYTCVISDSARKNGYSAADAPIVMSVYTPGYYSAEALTDVDPEMYIQMFKMNEFTSQGFVYVFPGCRGIDEGAPSGVTDLKAAVRYLRYCDDEIAGDSESIFAFGMSGGGAQAAILGASGDSGLYDPYLEKIGAVQGASDAIAGSMAWCPITSLDTADAEYEWMMGCTRPERSAEEKAISDKLAEAFARYVNDSGFTDENGASLTLAESAEGIYQAGSYYDYIKKVIEESLNHYLSDDEFYNSSPQEYVDQLNADKKWVNYDKDSNTATVTSVADFAKNCKQASDKIVAFDQPQSQNNLFGYGASEPSHYDKILADILYELKSEYAADYYADLEKTDFAGNNVEQRVNMYSPLYYLMKDRGGCGKANVAKYWRIRTGIEQMNTSLTTEVNLALALKNYDSVKNVDFETVWAQGHTDAERTGDSTQNFIEWVHNCMKG